MRRNAQRGVSTIEFALGLMVLVPLVLGTGAIGINLIRTQQTIQLARDAGHMYANGADFSLNGTQGHSNPGTGFQGILQKLGSSLGLNATDPLGQSGKSVVILSTLTYVDSNLCGVGANDPKVTNCPNLGQWVWVQRLVIGNFSIRTSNLGSPVSDDPKNLNLGQVNVDPQTGLIDQYTQAFNTGDVVHFNGAAGSLINPYDSKTHTTTASLPSGSKLYLAEAAAFGFAMPPITSGPAAYSFEYF